MIPEGRTAVDAAGVATLLGLSYDNLRKRGDCNRPEFPRGLRAVRRGQLWDREQVEAYKQWLAADEAARKAAQAVEEAESEHARAEAATRLEEAQRQAATWRAIVEQDLTALPPAPGDLLADEEAAQAIGITLDRWFRRMYAGESIETVPVCGIRHVRRGDVEARPRRSAGRPKGARDSAPRGRTASDGASSPGA